ncbi:sensor histidine kinase [Sedimentimonas flavescens]|uniref:sensor histidine kinase n=1 Tax=Sedimentimonas flavescens TaxID=2851012 RepID=UPI0021A8E52A|nr:sensor histidine kinase [Sedimentimonas flavescens]MCT2540408.1 sensor histidine kinase [Sedimentimonas flavescens]
MSISGRIGLGQARGGDTDVVLGEDWTGAESTVQDDLSMGRAQRGVVSLNRSPLARKIITFNLMAMVMMVAGVLYLNPFRDSLVYQRESAIVNEAGLIADVFEARMPKEAPVNLAAGDGIDLADTLAGIKLPEGTQLYLFDTRGNLLISSDSAPTASRGTVEGLEPNKRTTLITDLLNRGWDWLTGLMRPTQSANQSFDIEKMLGALVPKVEPGKTQISTSRDPAGSTIFSVATGLYQNDRMVGLLAITSAAGEIDELVRVEREQVLQMFVVAIIVSIGLSLVLASTIANPLADLAAAAEIGSDRGARKMSPARVRIPDLTARPDELGRLSAALRGMVAALYDRIDANEQFAADVAHEIKNPLASLRSAVASLHMVKRDDQRTKLLDVIDHDVRRLDRLVSDISNASRLDSELVKEEEQSFDLMKMVGSVGKHLGEQAAEKGIDFIIDLPRDPIVISGLEGRLAQVFVNLIGNAISFCEDGDAVRIWARRRDNRVLVVVEDTGPGIPDEALTKVFKRFYSQRPVGQFGDHSGLGLAISKQIVEAHGGVIWAENIRPTDADITSEPLGARFVVGLPL